MEKKSAAGQKSSRSKTEGKKSRTERVSTKELTRMDTAEAWFKLSQSVRGEHFEVMRVRVLSFLLFGQPDHCTDDAWRGVAKEAGVLDENNAVVYRQLADLDLVDMVQDALSAIKEHLNNQFLLDHILGIADQAEEHSLGNPPESSWFTTNIQKLAQRYPGLRSKVRFTVLLLVVKHVSDHIRALICDSRDLSKEHRRSCAKSEEATHHIKIEGNACFKLDTGIPKAIGLYSNAIRQNPFSNILYSNRCICYLKQSKAMLALVDGKRCSVLQPEWERGQHRYVQALIESGCYVKAKEANETARKICKAKSDLEKQYEAILSAIAKRDGGVGGAKHESSSKSKSQQRDGKRRSQYDDMPELVTDEEDECSDDGWITEDSDSAISTSSNTTSSKTLTANSDKQSIIAGKATTASAATATAASSAVAQEDEVDDDDIPGLVELDDEMTSSSLESDSADSNEDDDIVLPSKTKTTDQNSKAAPKASSTPANTSSSTNTASSKEKAKSAAGLFVREHNPPDSPSKKKPLSAGLHNMCDNNDGDDDDDLNDMPELVSSADSSDTDSPPLVQFKSKVATSSSSVSKLSASGSESKKNNSVKPSLSSSAVNSSVHGALSSNSSAASNKKSSAKSASSSASSSSKTSAATTAPTTSAKHNQQPHAPAQRQDNNDSQKRKDSANSTKSESAPVQQASAARKQTLERFELVDLLAGASQQLLLNDFNRALPKYRDALKAVSVNKKLMGDREHVVLLYSLASALVELADHNSLVEAGEHLACILHEFENISFPLVYYGQAQVHVKLNNYQEALEAVEKGLAMLKRSKSQLVTCTWPGTETVIAESRAKDYNEVLVDLRALCLNPPRPEAVCRYLECKTRRPIYLSDPDYKGYVRTTCTSLCHVDYHLTCWRRVRADDPSKPSEKDLLGSGCVTPDCEGRIYCINIHDTGRKAKKEFRDESLIKSKSTAATAGKQRSGKAKTQKVKQRPVDDEGIVADALATPAGPRESKTKDGREHHATDDDYPTHLPAAGAASAVGSSGAGAHLTCYSHHDGGCHCCYCSYPSLCRADADADAAAAASASADTTSMVRLKRDDDEDSMTTKSSKSKAKKKKVAKSQTVALDAFLGDQYVPRNADGLPLVSAEDANPHFEMFGSNSSISSSSNNN
eukprot:scpid27028/ scgid32198/ E3 ubiquitin-protein ligase TTC3; Protein DCRR1; RING finger protein 105; TPR repeat protein D; Tetratricopeptide repeat protein 3